MKRLWFFMMIGLVVSCARTTEQSSISSQTASSTSIDTSASVQDVLIKEYENSARVLLPQTVLPVLGVKTNPRIKIDIFFNPLCPSCRDLEATLNAVMEDDKYNKAVQINYHIVLLGFRDEEEISKMYLLAGKLGRFEDLHRAILNGSIMKYQEILWKTQAIVGKTVTPELLEEFTPVLKKEQMNADDLDIRSTPTLFINNYRMDTRPRTVQEWKDFLNYLRP